MLANVLYALRHTRLSDGTHLVRYIRSVRCVGRDKVVLDAVDRCLYLALDRESKQEAASPGSGTFRRVNALFHPAFSAASFKQSDVARATLNFSFDDSLCRVEVDLDMYNSSCRGGETQKTRHFFNEIFLKRKDQDWLRRQLEARFGYPVPTEPSSENE